MSKHSESQRRRSLQAQYTNYFQVGHNALEFIVDLGQYDPECSACRLHTRIVTGPVYAKLLSNLLQDSIARYEAEPSTARFTEPLTTSTPWKS